VNNEKTVLKHLLADTIKRNKSVLEEIRKTKYIAPPDFYIADGFTLDSEQEAYRYWRSNKTIWNEKHVKVFCKNNMKYY
jgi:D-alanyl-D-alanine carboxypeptidase